MVRMDRKGTRMKAAGLIVVTALASISFAQDFTNLAAYKNSPAAQEAARKAAGVKAVVELPQPAEGPVDKLDVNQFQVKQADYVGKVVELTFDQVLTLKQEGAAGYIATVVYERVERRSSDIASVDIAVPPEGLKTFQELYERNTPRRTTVMVQVIVGSKVRALGQSYYSDYPEGKKYVW